MLSVLLVDDERSMRDFLKILLKKEGFDVRTAGDGTQALEMLAERGADLVLSDIRMPGMNGIELLEQVKGLYPGLPMVMVTAFSSPDDAVQAMHNGAFDYISKPFNVNELKSVIHAAINSGNGYTEEPSTPVTSFSGIIGQSREMQKIFDMIRRVSPTPANVLIYGESGTGKELIAKAIHANSRAAENNFVPINCSAIPEDLMESELFGHVKGSFTGAISDKAGLFQEADHGTAFLDEIGELTPMIQTKLLRVLQEREIKPVGGTKATKLNIRIVAATNKILEDEIREGRFREDLFYRLAVVPLRIPPLRERKGDVPLLVNYFLEKYSRQLNKDIQEISSYAMQVLMNYDFPGNVRELENIIERGVALENSNIILPESLSFHGRVTHNKVPVRKSKSGKLQFLTEVIHYRHAATSDTPEVATASSETSGIENPFTAPRFSLPGETASLLQIASSEQELYNIGIEQALAALEKRLIGHAIEKTNSKMKAAELLKMSFRSLRYKAKKYGIN
ncbi:sigma-54-dependent Fis family transcriptional regulator [Desulforhopalus vacuolatus]|uniref:sigma-54-dependent transcriptional regulator n=1 Tax=Desulforhopalus vacuolatus TaxID=40414 RepID=UPI001963CE65|nr:sigma-54 dependent transcriptional regulator [Desulforhopalus vacuolatus]MBM9520695.1 sigma-54-dependent Fis family transcriptional regulator [Desulforhopalus vacuolatus]